MRNDNGDYIRCKCGKVCYTSAEAGLFLNKLKRKDYKTARLRNRHDYMPKRKYYCSECGYYHVTHRTHYTKKGWGNDKG